MELLCGNRGSLTLLCCLCLLLSSTAAAQTSQLERQIQSRTSEAEAADEILPAEDSDKRFFTIPLPVVDPTIGQGLALVGLYTFGAKGEDAASKEPRSTIVVTGGYTNTDSWMVGGGFQLFLDEDRYRTNLGVGYGNVNLKYYGTSSDSIFFDNPVDFLIRGSLVDGNVQKRVAENFFIGVSGRFIQPTIELNSAIDRLNGLKAKFNLAALGVVGEYDTRDNNRYPKSGSHGSIDILAYTEAIGSDAEFGSLDATFANYRSLTDKLVLAGQVRSSIVGDNAPYFMLSAINLRGFAVGRYLNQTITQVQGELRWEAWRRVGTVAFAGIGVAAEDFSDLGNGDRASGIGVGLRYRVSEADRLNAGLDVAYGSSDEIAVYFRIGEAF